jgi:hypothetical protein
LSIFVGFWQKVDTNLDRQSKALLRGNQGSRPFSLKKNARVNRSGY